MVQICIFFSKNVFYIYIFCIFAKKKEIDMNKVVVKKESECYSLVDNETGEVSELQETFIVNDEQWIKLYIEVFVNACENISGQSMMVFAICMKYMQKDVGDGNYVFTNGIGFNDDINRRSKINRSRCLKELCDKGLLERVKRGIYRINPQVAYLGNRHDRAKLILKIVNKRW